MSTSCGDSALSANHIADQDEPDETTSRTSSAIRSEPSKTASAGQVQPSPLPDDVPGSRQKHADSSPTVPAVQSHPPSPASAVVEETPNDVLKRVCKESLMNS